MIGCKFTPILVAVVCLFSLAAMMVGRGTCWITIAGIDFGYSNNSRAAVITKASGGFFYWFEAFSVREFEPKQFGSGYDPTGYTDETASYFPKVITRFNGKVTDIHIPFWILAGMALVAFIFLHHGTKNPAQQAADGKTPQDPQPPR
jgi:hypothetical protein